MPNGVDVYVEDGFATIDFVDPATRGPGVAKLIDVGGAETIETLTRSGPRRQYRVPEGNAREAGLLDEVTDGKAPDRDDLGSAAALVQASPDGARPVQPTSTTAYSQTMRGGAYRDGAVEATLVVPEEDVLGHASVSTTVGEEPGVSGLARLHRDVIAAGPAVVRVGGESVPTGTPVGVGSPTDATAASNVAPAAEVNGGKYPEGEPAEDWTRKQLDSYAANERQLDTSDRAVYSTKADVLNALKG